MSIESRFAVYCDLCRIKHRFFWHRLEDAEQFALSDGWMLEDGKHICDGCKTSVKNKKEKINASDQ